MKVSPSDMNEEVFLSKLSDAVIIAGRDGVIVSASRGTERVLGWSPDLLRHRRLASLIHEDFVAEAVKAFERVADGAELHLPQRWGGRRADGRWFKSGPVRHPFSRPFVLMTPRHVLPLREKSNEPLPFVGRHSPFTTLPVSPTETLPIPFSMVLRGT